MLEGKTINLHVFPLSLTCTYILLGAIQQSPLKSRYRTSKYVDFPKMLEESYIKLYEYNCVNLK